MQQKTVTPIAAQLIAASILLSTVVYAVIGVAFVHLKLIEPIIEASLAAKLNILAIALGLLPPVASLPLRGLLAAKWGGTMVDRIRITMICMAVAESSGVLGLLLALTSGHLAAPFILWGVSLGACILHFPARSWLKESQATNTPPSE